MTEHRIRVLCLAGYFLPGFKGGGPIRSLANMTDLLSDKVDFNIFTRDRDLGSITAYDGIIPDQWQTAQGTTVFYASPGMFGLRGLRAAVAGRGFDILYLNSFFGARSSILVYFWHRFLWRRRLPVLIAPRGGFSKGALALNPGRKRLFMAAVRLFGLYRDVHWHVSSPNEARDLLDQFPAFADRVHIAADLVSSDNRPAADLAHPPKEPGHLRLVFISRISPMKNLDGLLRYLAGVRHGISLDLYGPIEDAAHWAECQSLIAALPAHIVVTHKGALEPDKVSKTFADYDLFALPTLGENFGHVIFESLQAGTPVLISDRTLWQPDAAGALVTAPLEQPQVWQAALDAAALRDDSEQSRLRAAARACAARYRASDTTLSDNLQMFGVVAGTPS